jgi:AraC-like DNA-binding protein
MTTVQAKRKISTNCQFLVSDAQVNAEGVHVWPFAPHFPIDAIKHNLSGRRPFRMNRHDYVEIVYLNSGELVWQVQDNRVREQRGDLFVMLHPKYHRVTEESSPQVTAESLFFHPELLRSRQACKDESEYLVPFFSRDSEFAHVVPRGSNIPSEVLPLIRRIRKELPATSDRARLAVKTYVKMILVHVLDHFALTQEPFAPSDRRHRELDRFRPVFEFLDSRYSEHISPNDAADRIGMSPSRFRRAFKHLTGQSFVPYLNHFRIEKAQQLLAKPEIPISEVSLEVGFCDQSYFGLIFRRLTKMTPLQYRHRILSGSEKVFN